MVEEILLEKGGVQKFTRSQKLLPAGLLAAVSALALFLASPARAEDWPQWRGSNRDGVWSESEYPQAFPVAGLKIPSRHLGLTNGCLSACCFVRFDQAGIAAIVDLHACGQDNGLLAQDFLRQGHVIERPMAGGRIGEDRLAEARAFGQLDVAADVGLEDSGLSPRGAGAAAFVQVALQIVHDFLSQARARFVQAQ